ncbi:RING-1 like protein [Metarhizium album ARSEF 1941]|uniref:RING-type E3 ubiquitin transferase n=1 Tax=Metarhizium album (strain ARSEF 1941) TaxID=1081103 RepID=A0A0B2WR10_METAS|nr:RING-1 like protein [Metarhizium album ARSEF 1941]KHN96448.1 RING-1 like protein [Metarhizium album ARSEF 1941]
MASKPASSPTASPTASPYPFAAAPDIVRAHQKDAYFTGHLANTITDLYRRLFGARATHSLAPELRALAAVLYFGLTTLPGNRTLGEEYCDLVQVEAPAGRLPDARKRAAYIAGAILLPYLAGRALPRLRSRRKGDQAAREARAWEYLSSHLPSLTSAAPVQAVTLALFYFNGTYYDLTKRLLSLRYVFTRAVPDSPDRGGYEVLGVLLVIQLALQSYLHVQSTLSSAARREREREPGALPPSTLDVSLDHANSYSANSDLLLADLGRARGPHESRVDVALATHTPFSPSARFDLADAKSMRYVKGPQQRKCTLCLEEMKDPSATQCGHVFCWECIGDWVREKPECPLCRREATLQHILPLRVMVA